MKYKLENMTERQGLGKGFDPANFKRLVIGKHLFYIELFDGFWYPYREKWYVNVGVMPNGYKTPEECATHFVEALKEWVEKLTK